MICEPKVRFRHQIEIVELAVLYIVGGRGGLGAFLGADFLGEFLRGISTSSSSVPSVLSNTKRGFGL